eukprot:TRINITY_DN18595_c0_g1::TRINITY_DN18595_c0_g1_i1::g.1091::m.1091 TRINITY_DN18595_c0_g1::TRINITY_DN18595_c0_g1_i1::g.1091  ORF type:complete len:158 (-),score=14.18,sp/Q15459/SF3A1_HUMAN/42.31/3e-07,Surp/PF01805.15/2.6e-11 TRINITY_DN18595_c0_g1_i1:77-550(-)
MEGTGDEKEDLPPWKRDEAAADGVKETKSDEKEERVRDEKEEARIEERRRKKAAAQLQMPVAKQDKLKIVPPDDVKTRIDQTAKWVAMKGKLYEALLRKRNKSNDLFSFLQPGDKHHNYYVWACVQARAEMKPEDLPPPPPQKEQSAFLLLKFSHIR